MADELVGRDDDLAQIRAARLRGAPGVIVSAAPGMGRTSVFNSIVIEWRGRRSDVLLLRATASARSLRFAALSSVLPSDVDGPLTFDAVTDALAARIAAAPAGTFVLAIDDVQLVDEASLRVIADLLGRSDMFVLATIDETMLGQDPFTERCADANVEVVRLGPLSVDAIGALAASRLGEAVDAIAWHARCGGNPTALLAAIGSSAPEAGGIGGAGESTPFAAVTEHTVQVDVSTAARKLLNVVALAEPFPLVAAAAIAGQPALDELLDTGVVMVSDDSDGANPAWASHTGPDHDDLTITIRLRHPALGAQVRRNIGPLEARGARRAALIALRDGWHSLPTTGRLRLAALAVDAGVPLRDEELAEVARLAPVAGDSRLALRLVRDAANRLDRFEDHRCLADVAHEQGEVIDLESALERMRSTSTSSADRAATAIAESQHLLWRGADVEGALRALGRINLEAEPEVAAVRARLLSTVGRTRDGISSARPLVTHAEPRVRTQAAIAIAHGLRLQGRAAEAVSVLDDAIEAAGAVVDPVLSVSRQVLSVVQVLALLEAGRWADASARALQVVSYAQRYDEAPGRAIAMLVHGLASVEAGAPAPAVPTLGAAVEMFATLRQQAGVRWALGARALAHGLCGNAIGARNDLDRLHRMPPHPADLLPSLEPRARAWAMVAAAEPESARQVLQDAIAHLVDVGLIGAAWQCAHDLLSLDRPGALLDLEPIDGEPMSDRRIRHARAHYGRDVDALAGLVVEYEDAGGLRWAAECAAAASHALARNGAKQAERRAAEQLTALSARCVGLDIPSLSAGLTSKLSAREREIALLAARGLTSRAIGDRLGLSMRTVDNHLARCYDKLGARSRAELAELLGT